MFECLAGWAETVRHDVFHLNLPEGTYHHHMGLLLLEAENGDASIAIDKIIKLIKRVIWYSYPAVVGINCR
jgi:hypothetical protein